MPGLSIAVAIYKVEPYLKQCIDSILDQTYQDFELLLVDDGSPDGCPGICDEYAAKDPRIKVIHKENGGLPSARKAGIDHACGDYITFADGDDWLEKDTYQKMMNIIDREKTDILAAGLTKDYGSRLENIRNALPSGSYRGRKCQALKKKLLYTGHFYREGIFPSLCVKIFKTDLLRELDISVPKEIKMGEDASISFPALAKAESIAVANEIQGYHYRIFAASMCNTFDRLYFDRAQILFQSLEENLLKAGDHSTAAQLDYYRLSIIQVGIASLLARNSGVKHARIKSILKDVIAEFRLPELIKKTDFSGFSFSDRLFFRLLAGGHLSCFLFYTVFYRTQKYLPEIIKGMISRLKRV